jgi:hypothetical protein
MICSGTAFFYSTISNKSGIGLLSGNLAAGRVLFGLIGGGFIFWVLGAGFSNFFAKVEKGFLFPSLTISDPVISPVINGLFMTLPSFFFYVLYLSRVDFP